MNNKDKIIISLCGGTGSWERFYREAGYTVILITLPDYDVCQTQFGTDGHIYFYSPDGKGTMDGIDPKKVYGILAAPPCTKFSKADTGHPRGVRDFTKGMEIVEACLKIIWQAQMKGAPLAFWALENPQGYLSRFLGRSIFRFQHWEFGETRKALATKRTEIWGYFNSPTKIIRKRTVPFITTCKRENTNRDWQKISVEDRAKTNEGFAQAFYEANQ